MGKGLHLHVHVVLHSFRSQPCEPIEQGNKDMKSS